MRFDRVPTSSPRQPTITKSQCVCVYECVMVDPSLSMRKYFHINESHHCTTKSSWAIKCKRNFEMPANRNAIKLWFTFEIYLHWLILRHTHTHSISFWRCHHLKRAARMKRKRKFGTFCIRCVSLSCLHLWHTSRNESISIEMPNVQVVDWNRNESWHNAKSSRKSNEMKNNELDKLGASRKIGRRIDAKRQKRSKKKRRRKIKICRILSKLLHYLHILWKRMWSKMGDVFWL